MTSAQVTTPEPPRAEPPRAELARAELARGRTADQLQAVALRSRHEAVLGALADAAGFPAEPRALVGRLLAGAPLPRRSLVPRRTLPFTLALATAWAGMAREDAERSAAVEVYRQVLAEHGPRGLRRLEQRHYLQAAFLAGRHDLVREGLGVLDGVSADVTAGLRADLANPHVAQDGRPVVGAAPEDHRRWVELLGSRFVERGLAAPQVDPSASPALDGLSLAPGRSVDGPLVTVVVPAWRPGPELLTSVRSVLAQSYGHLEVLLVDDASGPEHEAVLAACEALDPRVRLLRQPVNGGSYLARNAALALARGAFVTTQDADDWSHPERVAAQVTALDERPDAVASRSVAIRARPDLTRQWFGYRPERMNASSLLLRREVLDRVGPFDGIRKGADSEMTERLRLVGEVVDVVRPLAITRLAAGSLSRADFSWGWHHPDRVLFRSSYRDWHNRVADAAVPASLPLTREGRHPYVVPRGFVRGLPPAGSDPVPRTAYPLVLLADAADPVPTATGLTIDGLAATVDRLAVLGREDLTLARVEQPEHATELLGAAREGRVDLLTDADEVEAAVLLVLEPSLLALPALPLPRLRAREVVVAAVPPGPHESPRDLEAAGSTARALSGRAPRWCARDAAEQQVWRTEGWELPLLGEVLRQVLPGQAIVRGSG
ncbi:glycosyltransferase family A protein [Ornithinimicrobium cerasi]|uniref:Glycosyl transferase family 2 n=1 Tax=Ornithinimicrobium cerasi TaxID=2248773 RepID=A0A285VVR5_9MICO|nr:glycosyltransferase family A protein [Ornithinimicrobium cerasi]SOC57346.1 Glycosyl transferase family 2 [Ornithinimicrobium cerasi]